jgi:hypothetical protein
LEVAGSPSYMPLRGWVHQENGAIRIGVALFFGISKWRESPSQLGKERDANAKKAKGRLQSKEI